MVLKTKKIMDSFTFSVNMYNLGSRHYQCLLMFLLLLVGFAMRVNLSVAVVAMTSPSGTYTDEALIPWTLYQQGIILGSFFWGYLILQPLAGHFSRVVGAKYLLLASMLLCSLISLMTPLIAYNCNWMVFCASRILLGLLQGFFHPCIATLQSNWAPPLESGRLYSFVFTGSQIGPLLSGLVCGYLAASAWGWPSIFYVSGLCGLVWTGFWWWLGADSPDSHPRISPAERLYINTALKASHRDSNVISPWMKILTSVPVWAIVIDHLGQNWAYWMLATMVPSYLSYVLKFDIEDNGLFTALPFLTQVVFIFACSWADDFIRKRNLFSRSFTRKTFNSIGHWGGAVALVALVLTTSAPAVVALLTLALTLNGATYSGMQCNHMDLSRNFAGSVMGVTNGLAAIGSILGPTVTGIIVQNKASRSEWLVAFYVAAAVMFVGNLIFLVFGSATSQSWDEPTPEVGGQKINVAVKSNGDHQKRDSFKDAPYINEGFLI